jgi:hypothetical protein
MLRISYLFLLSICFVIAIPGYGWEFEQNIIIEGVLRRAERAIIKDPNGKKETKVEKSIVLVTDKPLILSRSVTMEKQQIASIETSYPHIGVYLPEEFMSLIGKRVQCNGYFQRLDDHSTDAITLHINTALDCEQPIQKTVSYEPVEVEVSGLLYEEIYPGPPEYTSVAMGDRPERAVFLTLNEPINVEIKKGEEVDSFNESEKGVRELQVVFSDSMPTAHQMKKEIALSGTLYHAHTAHHQRRVLMMVKSWKVK